MFSIRVRAGAAVFCAAAVATQLLASTTTPSADRPAAGVSSLSLAAASDGSSPPGHAGTPIRGPQMAGSGPDARSVDRLYLAYFQRPADASGLAYWSQRRATGTPLASISHSFALSPEFKLRYGLLSDASFVDLVYRNVLGRTPDAGGRAYWIAALSRDSSRGAVMLGFSDSEEFKRRSGVVDSSPAPVSTAPKSSTQLPTAPAGSYTFMQTDGGTPVQWRPCEPVPVVVNFAGAPAGAESALRSALAAISAATKQSWVLEGTTTERAPSMEWSRPFSDKARYGSRYSPVLVSWASSWPADATAVGVGGFATLRSSSAPRRIVTGAVTLDPGYRPTSAKLVHLLMHELGHVANLGHTSVSSQVMYGTIIGTSSYQNGDLAGLARVGSWLTDCSLASARAAQTEDTSAVLEWQLVDD